MEHTEIVHLGRRWEWVEDIQLNNVEWRGYFLLSPLRNRLGRLDGHVGA